jgi:hypothetical protein
MVLIPKYINLNNYDFTLSDFTLIFQIQST